MEEKRVTWSLGDQVKSLEALNASLLDMLNIPRLLGTKDIGGSVVLEEVTDEVVQQPEPKLRKSKRNRTSKDFGPEFQLYLIERTRDGVSSQHSYCFNVEDDPKTFDEAMKSQDVAFWKEAINDEMDSILGNNTWVLADLPPGCKPLGCKWIFKRKLKVDGTIKKFKARLVIQGFRQKSGIYYIDTYAPVARISTLRLLIAMTSIHNLNIHQMDVRTTFLNADKCVYSKFDEFGKGVIISLYVDDMLIFSSDQVQVDLTKKFLLSRLIGCLMYAMTCTRPDIAFAMGKLSRLTYTGYPSVLEGYIDASWISNTKDNSSTNGWVFLLAASKEAEWLKNLLLEIPLWSKPIAPIFNRYDSVATLAKAYSQMYNGKSRHLGIRHNMIRELITNEVVSIEFVRSQQNLAHHLTKRLARDLVLKSAEGMGLKSN
ncbi:zinc finger, CCHC-type containing protein [Tanacetum coccineum]